jgi:hypothetical protein
VSFDESTIENHGFSDWSTSNSSGRPVAVVYPRTTEEVSKIAKLCNEFNVPMGRSGPMSNSNMFYCTNLCQYPLVPGPL